MDLAPDAQGKPRRVVIQLMPEPFSRGWIANIRKLAAAHWWDGTAIVRLQDNYVAQWGDPDAEDDAKAMALPAGIEKVPETEYVQLWTRLGELTDNAGDFDPAIGRFLPNGEFISSDVYAKGITFFRGWPLATDEMNAAQGRKVWPVHCYGMVGVGRNMSPDTGSGAELYAVIGHAPRHLDRNVALVGRVVEGIEHLSSLPRGTEALGFYETAAERTAIKTIRLASELPTAQQPRIEYLDTASESFTQYAIARANRKDAFFNVPAGGADICNIPVPVRKIAP